MSATKHDVIVSTMAVEEQVKKALKKHGLEVIFNDKHDESGQTLRVLEMSRDDISLSQLPSNEYVVLRISDDGEYRSSGFLPENVFGLEMEVTAGIEIAIEHLPEVQKLASGKGVDGAIKLFFNLAEEEESDESQAYKLTIPASSPDFVKIMNGIRALSEGLLSDQPEYFRSIYYDTGRAILAGDLSETCFIGPDSVLLLTTNDGRNGRLRPNGEGVVFDEELDSSVGTTAWPF